MNRIQITLAAAVAAFCGQAVAGPDEAAVISLLEAQSKAESAFPRTLDVASVLNIYAPDSANVNDGKLESLANVKASLEQLEELVNLGKQIGISSKRTNIVAKSVGPGYVFVSFDFTSKAAESGTVMYEKSGKCTTLFKKFAASWKIQNEHCSSLPSEPEGPVVDAPPAPEIP